MKRIFCVLCLLCIFLPQSLLIVQATKNDITEDNIKEIIAEAYNCYLSTVNTYSDDSKKADFDNESALVEIQKVLENHFTEQVASLLIDYMKKNVYKTEQYLHPLQIVYKYGEMIDALSDGVEYMKCAKDDISIKVNKKEQNRITLDIKIYVLRFFAGANTMPYLIQVVIEKENNSWKISECELTKLLCRQIVIYDLKYADSYATNPYFFNDPYVFRLSVLYWEAYKAGNIKGFEKTTGNAAFYSDEAEYVARENNSDIYYVAMYKLKEGGEKEKVFVKAAFQLVDGVMTGELADCGFKDMLEGKENIKTYGYHDPGQEINPATGDSSEKKAEILLIIAILSLTYPTSFLFKKKECRYYI